VDGNDLVDSRVDAPIAAHVFFTTKKERFTSALVAIIMQGLWRVGVLENN
jgi:hypothetical protein